MDESLRRARRFIRKRPCLVWSVKDPGGLSLQAIVESVLNFGGWADFLELKRAVGLRRLKLVFNQLLGKKRVNLRPRTRNFFARYLSRYA